MQFIFKSVNSEMRKIGGRKLLLFSLFFSLLSSFLCISYFIFNKNNPDMFQSTNLIAITVNFNTLTLSIFSACMWYFIISSENKYGTWAIIYTKPISKFKLLVAKNLLFILFYLIFNILNFSVMGIYIFINGYEISILYFLKMLLLCTILSLAIPYSQLLFHLIIKKGILAASLSVIWIFFSVTYGLFPVVFTKTFPIFYALNIVSDVMMKETTILIYLASSSIYILGIMLLAVSFKYYTYE
ncbi:ABC transporter permease [Bacillus cereus]|uniref:ABC transporter permease n=2 Tax=Bacillus cereus TaxID=1396 RepID=UPI000BEBA1F6|nr:ABC transporter permease [Bacillus cereus]MDA2110365.1 ABC transporter permease [Bacillus cereus]MDA2127248.1 ABC transporter permease [Bacillus cereus]MDA2149866.1 ABC transporter permease [Bacillus cereus]MEB8995377.1 ABC transporter permease [Bacillus cereus]MEB9179213.1 ABC transporter permease [Bacillus cereus]